MPVSAKDGTNLELLMETIRDMVETERAKEDLERQIKEKEEEEAEMSLFLG